MDMGVALAKRKAPIYLLSGRRLVPIKPGRTTMQPSKVRIGHDAANGLNSTRR